MEPDEVTLTSGILLAFGFGWALLAVLSVRFSDQPQWWAAAPAVFFGLIGGLTLILAKQACRKPIGDGLDRAGHSGRHPGLRL